MMTSRAPQAGDPVICADDIALGTVEADEGTHLRVRRRDETPATVWVAKDLVGGVVENMVRLVVRRDELHDGVIAMPPARQREYGTLEAVSLLRRRAHQQARAVPTPAADLPPTNPA